MKELESQFEEGRWLPFNRSIILQDEVNKVVPVSTTAGRCLSSNAITAKYATTHSSAHYMYFTPSSKYTSKLVIQFDAQPVYV